MTPGEISLCTVALNHNDFDTVESHVLQATKTTVVSSKSKPLCVFCKVGDSYKTSGEP